MIVTLYSIYRKFPCSPSLGGHFKHSNRYPALIAVATGTHTLDVPGIPASGNEIFITGAALHRVTDGIIPETWFVLYTLGMLAQMGMVTS